MALAYIIYALFLSIVDVYKIYHNYAIFGYVEMMIGIVD